MADLTGLNLAEISEVDQIAWESYEGGVDPSKYAPPKAGRYMGQAPDKFEFGTTNEGKLKVTIDPVKLTDGDKPGYEVRFTRASVAKYKNRNGSPMGDYLRSCGVIAQPKTNQEYADLVESTRNRVFPLDLDWSAYCKDCQQEVARTYDDFPEDGNGGKMTSIKCPTCGKVVYANARVRRFISTVA